MSTECVYYHAGFDKTRYGDGPGEESLVVALRRLSENEPHSHVLTATRTIFHPQGGGQPADQGLVCLKDYSWNAFRVNHVVKTTVGGASVLEHLGCFVSGADPGAWSERAMLTMVVDRDRRLLNSRLHTAGHLIDYALHGACNVPREWLAGGRGYHFPDAPYVEIIVQKPKEQDMPILNDPSALKAALQHGVDDLVRQNLAHEAFELAYGDIPAQSRSFLSASTSESAKLRLLRLQGHEDMLLPCGGTHLSHTGLVQVMTIGKITVKMSGCDDPRLEKILIKVRYNVSS